MQFASTAQRARRRRPIQSFCADQMVLDAVNTQATKLCAPASAPKISNGSIDTSKGIQELQTQIMRAQGPKVAGKLVDPDMAYPDARRRWLSVTPPVPGVLRPLGVRDVDGSDAHLQLHVHASRVIRELQRLRS